jgi:arginyl-tRNA synthetase
MLHPPEPRGDTGRRVPYASHAPEPAMKHLVKDAVTATLAALHQQGALKTAAPRDVAFTVDATKNATHGDFACNVAMVLAKSEGQPPRKLAESIVAALVDVHGAIDKVDVAGPGFLNFTLTARAVTSVARTVLAAGETWGRSPSTGRRVLVEFVSANPTGPVHIGHARGTFVGDALSRLLSAAGHDVVREFYINDWGKQVETLGRTIHKRYRELFGQQVALADGEYPAEYVKDIARAWRDEDGARWLDQPEYLWLERAIEIGVRENIAAIKSTLAKAGVQHDTFFAESTLHKAGKVRAIVEQYKERGATYDADAARGTEDKVRRDDSKAAQFEDRQMGGTFLKTADHGDDEDRIILRRDGTPVYLTADLTYHKDKFERGFDRIINVFGADHAGHVPRLKAGMTLLGHDSQKLDFVLVQIVRLVRNGQEVKVSKRKGTVFELADLIEEVGADPCRFIFLMKTANAQLDFDLDVVEKKSSDNPVFTFQYGHARCASILKKAVEQGVAFAGLDGLTPAVLDQLVLPEERAMLKKMSLLPEVVVAAAEALEPHRVLYYCQELIAEFHSYFTKYKKTERVIGDDRDKTQARLALVAALKATLKSAFSILGVDAPDHMTAPEEDAEAGA